MTTTHSLDCALALAGGVAVRPRQAHRLAPCEELGSILLSLGRHAAGDGTQHLRMRSTAQKMSVRAADLPDASKKVGKSSTEHCGDCSTARYFSVGCGVPHHLHSATYDTNAQPPPPLRPGPVPYTHPLHHGQVLEVLVRLKQRIPHSQLHQDAPTAPHVTWVAPAQTQDHLHMNSTRNVVGPLTTNPVCRRRCLFLPTLRKPSLSTHS